MRKVYLLLGSNLGDRPAYLQRAASSIEAEIGHVLQRSDIYETQSWGKTDAPDYLNQVLLVETLLQPQQLLGKLLKIELTLGRLREERWGSRTVDIDILFYEDEIIREPNLIIPHPELQNRRFTLEPLAQIAPNFVHPVLKQTILELKTQLDDKLLVKKYIFE